MGVFTVLLAHSDHVPPSSYRKSPVLNHAQSDFSHPLPLILGIPELLTPSVSLCHLPVALTLGELRITLAFGTLLRGHTPTLSCSFSKPQSSHRLLSICTPGIPIWTVWPQRLLGPLTQYFSLSLSCLIMGFTLSNTLNSSQLS